MRILIVTTNPSKAAYFEALLADADAVFVTPCAARREGWPLDSLSLNPEGGLLPGCTPQGTGADGKAVYGAAEGISAAVAGHMNQRDGCRRIFPFPTQKAPFWVLFALWYKGKLLLSAAKRRRVKG